MSDAPERIDMLWYEDYGNSVGLPINSKGNTEYIRADLYYDLETRCDNYLDRLGMANIELSEQTKRIEDLEAKCKSYRNFLEAGGFNLAFVDRAMKA